MKTKTSLRNRCIEYTIKSTQHNRDDLSVFIADNEVEIYRLLQREVKKNLHVKFQISINVKLGKYTLADRRYVTISPWFNSSMVSIFARGTKHKLTRAFRQIIGFYDAFVE